MFTCSNCGKEKDFMMQPFKPEKIYFCSLSCLEEYVLHQTMKLDRKPKDEKAVLRGKKAQNNGKYFEKIVLAECNRLQQLNKGIVIRKLEEERVKKAWNPKKQFAYKRKLWSDFVGYTCWYEGKLEQSKFIGFECKSTDDINYFPFSNLKYHQIEFLRRVHNDKGIAFLLLFFSKRDKNNVLKIKLNEDFYNLVNSTKVEKIVDDEIVFVYTKGINYNDLLKYVDKGGIMNIISLKIVGEL